MNLIIFLSLFLLYAIPVFAEPSHTDVVNAALDAFDQTVAPQIIVNEPEVQEVAHKSIAEEHVEDLAPEESKELDRTPYKSLDDFPEGIKQALDPRHVHTLEVAQETYSYHYKESIPIKIHGLMTGVSGKYAYRPADGNFFNNIVVNTYMLEGRFAGGKLDYKGSGVINDKENVNYEIRGLLGKDLLLADRSLITPYFGFGYRYLLDNGNDRRSSTGQYAYDRTSQYFYLPIGVYGSMIYGKWTSLVNVEYDIFLGGLQDSELSSVNTYSAPTVFPDVHNTQKHGYGVRASYKLMYSVYKINFFVEPFIRIWGIGDSVSSTKFIAGVGNVDFLEPKNTTMEIGSKFGVQF